MKSIPYCEMCVLEGLGRVSGQGVWRLISPGTIS